MIGHFAFLAARTFLKGTPEDLFWISHVGTLMGGIGALFRNRLLISISLVALLSHHLFWLMDTSLWLISGHFPLGTTTYLKDATPGDWLQSSNHFFSVPFLLVLAYLQGGVDKHAWIGSTALFASLVLISFWFLPPTANVNSAHNLWPGMEKLFLSGLHSLSQGWYVVALIALNGLGNYWLSNLVLRGMYALVLNARKSL